MLFSFSFSFNGIKFRKLKRMIINDRYTKLTSCKNHWLHEGIISLAVIITFNDIYIALIHMQTIHNNTIISFQTLYVSEFTVIIGNTAIDIYRKKYFNDIYFAAIHMQTWYIFLVSFINPIRFLISIRYKLNVISYCNYATKTSSKYGN